jgi:CubicO group peptidase (beta-lactamase class C family)
MTASAAPYTPSEPASWAAVAPGTAGFDPARLAAVPALHTARESGWPRSLFMPDGAYAGTHYIGDKPPHDMPIGPVTPRGGPAGMILRGGRVALRWGDIDRADMVFSVAKSFLGVLAGLALARVLIGSLDDRVADQAPRARAGGLPPDNGFEGAHNGAIAWRHLLDQTSEWTGTLWGKPDSVDHNRQVGAGARNDRKGEARTLRAPGTHWEYNDVRVNRLSLSLMWAFRRPLPEVLDETIMAPIGATGWTWRGYENSTVTIDGRAMESVSGGGHWGGGLVIPTRALALFGLLIARRGAWAGRQLLPADWIDRMVAPSAANPSYGLMWWLNTGRALHPAAPATSFFAKGAGGHLLWIDPALDLVVVARWIDRDSTDDLIAAVMDAMAPGRGVRRGLRPAV